MTVLLIVLSCFVVTGVVSYIIYDSMLSSIDFDIADKTFVLVLISITIFFIVGIGYSSGKSSVQKEFDTYKEMVKNQEKCKPYTYVKGSDMCIDPKHIKEIN